MYKILGIFVFLFFFGCAATSPIEQTILREGNTAIFEMHKTESIPSVLGKNISIDIVFMIDDKTLTIKKVFPKGKSGDFHGEQSDNQKFGCLSVFQGQYSICSNKNLEDPFITGDGYLLPKTTQNRISYIYHTIAFKIYNEFKIGASSTDPSGLEAFVERYLVTEGDSLALTELLQMYRAVNDFDSRLKAYKISNDKEDLRQAYNVATTDAQREQVIAITEELLKRELIAAGAAVMVFEGGKAAIKWLFNSLLSSPPGYSSTSNAQGSTKGDSRSSGSVSIDVSCESPMCNYRDLQIKPASGSAKGHGEFKPRFSGAGDGAIFKGFDGRLDGEYVYSVRLEPFSAPKAVCSGKFNLKGTESTYFLRLYTSCREAGSFAN